MNGLLPHAVEQAVRARSVYGASQSFGAVVVVLLLLLALEWEAVRMLRGRSGQWILLTVLSIPLVLVVGLLLVARLAPLVP
jgi:hypothetical protein